MDYVLHPIDPLAFRFTVAGPIEIDQYPGHGL